MKKKIIIRILTASGYPEVVYRFAGERRHHRAMYFRSRFHDGGKLDKFYTSDGMHGYSGNHRETDPDVIAALRKLKVHARAGLPGVGMLVNHQRGMDAEECGMSAQEQTPTGWRSFAEWESERIGPNYTSDTHHTKAEAVGVCAMLHRDGFGGDRIKFPLRTWVEPLYDTKEAV